MRVGRAFVVVTLVASSCARNPAQARPEVSDSGNEYPVEWYDFGRVRETELDLVESVGCLQRDDLACRWRSVPDEMWDEHRGIENPHWSDIVGRPPRTPTAVQQTPQEHSDPQDVDQFYCSLPASQGRTVKDVDEQSKCVVRLNARGGWTGTTLAGARGLFVSLPSAQDFPVVGHIDPKTCSTEVFGQFSDAVPSVRGKFVAVEILDVWFLATYYAEESVLAPLLELPGRPVVMDDSSDTLRVKTRSGFVESVDGVYKYVSCDKACVFTVGEGLNCQGSI